MGQESLEHITRCRKGYGAPQVSVFSLTPHVESITQRIKAGKQRMKLTLVGTPWEIPRGTQVGGRDLERLFLGLCKRRTVRIPAERAAGSSLWQTAAARDKAASGQTKLSQALGRQIHIHIAPLMAETREFNSCSYLHSFWISDSGHLYLQRRCAKFSHACHSYELY